MGRRAADGARFALLLLMLTLNAGCVRAMATSALADALAGSGGVYGRDDDPELIEGAVPFGLKTMEAVLVEQPEHRGLLTALASGFVQYGVAFVSLPADVVATESVESAERMKLRAKRLFLRAFRYGVRGLEVEHPDFEARLKKEPQKVLARTKIEDVPLLYWTAAAWGSAISADKSDTAMIADLGLVQAIADRVMALDPNFGDGAVYELFIALESTRPGGAPKRARDYFQRAVELSGGKRAGPFVALAEAVSVKEQNLAEFNLLLDRALAIDLEEKLEYRLANVIMQRRAVWLKSRAPDLFLDAEPLETDTSTTAR